MNKDQNRKIDKNSRQKKSILNKAFEDFNASVDKKWVKKFLFTFSVFLIMGLLVGYVYGIHDKIEENTVDNMLDFFKNPEKLPKEAGYEFVSLMITVGIYSTVFKLFFREADKISNDYFWDEVGSLYRIIMSSIGGFSASVLILFNFNREVSNITHHSPIVPEYIFLLFISFFVGLMPSVFVSLFIKNEDAPKTELICEDDKINKIIDDLSIKRFILCKISFFVRSIFS